MLSALESIEYQRKIIIEDISKLETKLKELDNKKEELLQRKVVCPTCKGKGEERYTDAAGDGDWRVCKTCRGIGKVKDLDCACGNTVTTDMIKAFRKRECPWCGKTLGY